MPVWSAPVPLPARPAEGTPARKKKEQMVGKAWVVQGTPQVIHIVDPQKKEDKELVVVGGRQNSTPQGKRSMVYF